MATKNFRTLEPQLVGAAVVAAFNSSNSLDVDVVRIDKATQEITLRFQTRTFRITAQGWSITVFGEMQDDDKTLVELPGTAVN